MKIAIAASLLAILVYHADVFAQWPGSKVPDSLSFQGYLTDTGGDVVTDGNYNLLFKMYKGTNMVWEQNHLNVPVDSGRFNVILSGTVTHPLDTVAFNKPIDLGITINGGTEILPRTPLTAAPYALGMRGMHAKYKETTIWRSMNLIGGAPNNTIESGVGSIIAGGGGLHTNGTPHANTLAGDFSTISGGRDNSITAHDAVISGGKENLVTHWWGTIGGGHTNLAGESGATVAGGTNNSATGIESAVGGGTYQQASGWSATIAGGSHNIASSGNATVGGGGYNKARGHDAAISGGFNNVADGAFSTVSGGEDNAARGDYSLAAGFRARVNHEGTYLWNDRSQTGLYDTLGSSAANQYIVRASGGVGLGTNKPKRGLTISRDVEEPAYQLELRNVGDIHGGNFTGIAFTQTDSGATESASIKVIYHSNGKPDMSFSVRDAANALFIESISGDIGIGTTTPATELEVVGTITETSDARFKRDVSPIRHALSLVEGLQGVTFEWDQEAWPDRGFSAGRQIGLIAQEVQEVVPEVVHQGDDGHYAVAYAKLVPLLIEAIKEQQATIDVQNERARQFEATQLAMLDRLAEMERRMMP